MRERDREWDSEWVRQWVSEKREKLMKGMLKEKFSFGLCLSSLLPIAFFFFSVSTILFFIMITKLVDPLHEICEVTFWRQSSNEDEKRWPLKEQSAVPFVYIHSAYLERY